MFTIFIVKDAQILKHRNVICVGGAKFNAAVLIFNTPPCSFTTKSAQSVYMS